MHTTAVVAAVTALLFSSTANCLYTKSSPVLQVDSKSYDRLINKSNHTSIVEFYAPWCGHCQNLKPNYEKAATSLKGLAKVAAVDCDEDLNKPLCGQMGVQGFPTLNIVRPGKKPGNPSVEDYQGARTAKMIVDAVKEKIPNHVKRIKDDSLAGFLKEGNDTAKAILFSDKGTISPLLKALAIDFLGSISVAQVRNIQEKAVETFGVSEYPTLVLLPGGDKPGIVYDGEMKKDAMVTFLSQVHPPNPDPAPVASKPKPKAKKDKKKEKAFSKASESHSSQDASSMKLKATSVSVEEQGPPTESPNPIVDDDTPPPVEVPYDLAKISTLESEDELSSACLAPKSGTCILALLPAKADPDALLPENAMTALRSLGDISNKHKTRGGHLFPFYSIPATNAGASRIRGELSLKPDSDIEIIATNTKRSWWRHFPGENFGRNDVETWIDGIRMGEGKKEKLPEGLVVQVPEKEEAPIKESEPVKAGDAPEPAAAESPEPVAEEKPKESAAEPEPEPEPKPHDEL